MADAVPLLVACLCAEWCGSCREYRATFDRLAAEFDGLRFVWIDIEDEAELVDPIEVETFPTLLIADAASARFFGPLTPQPETLRRLVQQYARAAQPSATAVGDAAVAALVMRLRSALAARP